MKKVLIISGPTASGKTSTSIKTAQSYNAEIVNFDSLLFYRELNIGVAKPTEAELQSVPHHFVSCTSVAEVYNASVFSQMAIEVIEEIHKRDKPVILVGGSGFYLQALLQGMYNSPSTPQEVLDKSEQVYQEHGIDAFLSVLKENDPKSLERYHQNDHYRIRRAVEHFWAWGTKFSEVRNEKDDQDQSQWPMVKLGWEVYHAYLDIPKDQHFEIIQERTKKMLADGLIDEVIELLKTFSGIEKPLQSIGYKEVQMFLKGDIESLQACEERINISTRQLAKSQRTWFKSREKNQFAPLSDSKKLFKNLSKFLD